MKKQDIGFMRGVGYAIALLWRDAQDFRLAKYVLNESGLDYEEFVKAEVDEYDLVEIKKAWKELKEEEKN